MTPAEEDALVELHAPDCFDNPNCDDVRESFRLAIRAAVAHERERADAAMRQIHSLTVRVGDRDATPQETNDWLRELANEWLDASARSHQ